MAILSRVDLLDLGVLKTPKVTSTLLPVTSMAIFVPSSKNFDPDGLFSTDIFGIQGTPQRMENNAYIDLKIDHIHPGVYKLLVSAREFYAKILGGVAYATFNNESLDFDESTIEEGDTGYSFFIKHINDLTPSDTGSQSRNELLKLLKLYKGRLTINRLIVIPAGLRDYSVDASGKPSEDEINPLYRRVLASSNLIPPGSKSSDKELNSTRLSTQNSIQAVYDNITTILFGKHKFINKQFASRRIHGGTKNVITSMKQSVQDLDSPEQYDINDIVVGLFQAIKGNIHQTVYALRNGFLEDILNPNIGVMKLVHKKTQKSSELPLDFDLYDTLQTKDGVNLLMNNYKDKSIKSKPIEYKDYYLAMIYENDKSEFMVISDIDQVPTHTQNYTLRPITLTDIFYLSVFHRLHGKPGIAKRYPVMSVGGVFVGKSYIKPTTDTEVRYEVDTEGNRLGEPYTTYPIASSGYFNSMNIHPTHLSPAAGDFDGDKMGFTMSSSDESIKELEDYLDSPIAYIGPTGDMLYTPANTMVDLVIKTITKLDEQSA